MLIFCHGFCGSVIQKGHSLVSCSVPPMRLQTSCWLGCIPLKTWLRLTHTAAAGGLRSLPGGPLCRAAYGSFWGGSWLPRAGDRHKGKRRSHMSSQTSPYSMQSLLLSLLASQNNSDAMEEYAIREGEYQKVGITGGHLGGWLPQSALWTLCDSCYSHMQNVFTLSQGSRRTPVITASPRSSGAHHKNQVQVLKCSFESTAPWVQFSIWRCVRKETNYLPPHISNI